VDRRWETGALARWAKRYQIRIVRAAVEILRCQLLYKKFTTVASRLSLGEKTRWIWDREVRALVAGPIIVVLATEPVAGLGWVDLGKCGGTGGDVAWGKAGGQQ
jgi:ABC-type ATPase involved in cell division